MAFITVAAVEEGAKFLVVRFLVYPKKELQTVRDGLLFTVCASMGFALFENIIYTLDRWVTVLLRGFTAVLLHIVASGIMGCFIGRAKLQNRRDFFLKGFLIAVLIHGLYDFFLFIPGGLFSLLNIPLLIIGGLYLLNLSRPPLAGKIPQDDL
jgi:RsiW-degrading membrane proteinase PrsW (M82 family)